MTRLPELERALMAAARRRAGAPPQIARRAVRLPVLAMLGLMVMGAVTAAALLRDPPDDPAALRTALDPRPGSVRLGPPVRDPRGGRPWRLRTWRTAAGDLCAQPGRATDRGFGLLFGERFAPLRFTQQPACGFGSLRVLRIMSDPRDPQAQLVATVVFGVLRSGEGTPTVRAEDVRRRAATARGGFLAVLEGGVPKGEITVRTEDGRTLADFRSPDVSAPAVVPVPPANGEPFPWALRAWTGSGEQRCHLTGRLVDGAVGELAPMIPGAFTDLLPSEGRCVPVPGRNHALSLHALTRPADPARVDDGPTSGFLFLAGHTHPSVRDVAVRAPVDSRGSLVFSRSLRAYVGVYALTLERPFARDLAERFRGSFIVTARVRGGREVKRTVP